MKAETLKKSILQYAMEGKLVPQNPNDEPASELLKRVKAEKEQLIKDGKIKKEKPLPPITEEEIPYELPQGWEWVRLGEIIKLISGQDLTPNDYNNDGKGIPYITGASNFDNNKIVINRWTEYPKSEANYGDLLITCKGTVGTMAFLTIKNAHIARQIMSISTFSLNNLNFIKTYLESYISILKQSAKSMIPGISRNDIQNLIIPLPPLEEQKRIVEKLEEILPLVDEYGKNEELLTEMNKKLPKQIRQSILQYAVQGKLVEQNPSDEPASELLKRIKHEKEQLIKDGKLKKEKALPPITDDEIPYELPKGWEWVRFQDVVKKIGSGSTPKGGKNVYLSEGIKFIRSQNVYNEGLVLQDIAYISKDMNDKMKNTIVQSGDILLNITGGSIGRSCLIPDSFDIANVNQHVSIVRPIISALRFFMHLYIISPIFFSIIMGEQNGISREGFSKTMHEQCLFPLPPLEEQKRIVAKVDELMKIVDKLEV